MHTLRLIATSIAVFCGLSGSALADLALNIVYLKIEQEVPPTLSNLDPEPETLGVDGAALGITDTSTTGRFLGHSYALEQVFVPLGDDVPTAARAALDQNQIIIVDAPAETLLAIADLPEATNALLLNAASADVALRGDNCRANVLHTLPSNAMRADALMQFVLFKRWNKLAMISGSRPDDIALAEAFRASATKFGLKIRKQKTWAFDADMRRAATQEIPVFTQDLGDYDLLLVADALNDFARYIPYNTWLPRPVAGSEGLVPTGWDAPLEQWGAVQLQERFVELAGRPMQARDYAAWAAVRAVGEAVTRTNSDDAATLRAFLLSPEFELAGFKGRALSFRDWNGQLRQPIPLVTRGALAAQAPLPGFLHQNSELDTLGQDRPETTCEAFQ